MHLSLLHGRFIVHIIKRRKQILANICVGGGACVMEGNKCLSEVDIPNMLKEKDDKITYY